MLSLLLIVFVVAAVFIILVLSVVGAVIFRKRPASHNQQIDPENVIDVTPRDVE